MQSLQYRTELPQMTDRLRLGRSAFEVSPICLGMVPDPEMVVAAFDMGVNFFFLSADLHWSLYEGVRRGLELLMERRSSARAELVVAVASYLEQPLFQYLQLQEVLESVRNLRRIDLALAGAVSGPESLAARLPSLAKAKVNRLHGVRAIGASHHHRPTALAAINQDVMDLHFIRLNTGHPGARTEILPKLRQDRAGLVFSFTSMMGRVPESRIPELGLPAGTSLPEPTDYYRYVLSHAGIDGMLCAPRSLRELEALHNCLQATPLSGEQMANMEELSAKAKVGIVSDQA